MAKCKFRFWDMLLFVLILALCFGVSIFMQDVFDIPEQITATFAFAAFLISLCTEGHFLGLAGSVVSMLLVNFAFTYPYFELNFVIPSAIFFSFLPTVST